MNDPAFLEQLEGVRKRAARERSVITGLDWRHGHLRATLRKRREAEAESRVECDWYYGGDCTCRPKVHTGRAPIQRGVQGELL